MFSATVNDLVESTGKIEIWGRLGWMEIQRRYRRTAIGPFWTTISVGIFIFALGFLWARLWGVARDDFIPYLTGGMIAWALISGVVTEGCSTFAAAKDLLQSQRMPLMLLAYAVIWRNIIIMLHNLVLFVLVMFVFDSPLNAQILFFIPAVALVFVNGVWVAALLGGLCCRFRDIQQVVVSVLQVTMFCTPVLWSVDRLPPDAHFWIQFNIFYHFVEIMRAPLLGQQAAPLSWAIVVVWTIVGWAVTFVFIEKFRKRIPYWL